MRDEGVIVDKKDEFFNKKSNSRIKKQSFRREKKKSKKKFIYILLVFLVILLLGGVFFVLKTGNVITKISESSDSSLESIFGILRMGNEVATDEQGRTNVLLLGIRGENMVGGGLLTDTIMLASLKKGEAENATDDKIGLVSIPRDLYVKMPNTESFTKINAAYHYGEENQNTTGIKDMKKVVSEVTGLEIHYAIVLNFKGFEELVDAVGGVEIDLKEPFVEPIQFHEMKVCDGDIGGSFTVKTGEFEEKIDHRGKVVASYPLCYNAQEECGGIFSLPAGKQTLDGETALCYVRARKTSSDFDRARRQQLILERLREKFISLDFFSDLSKMNGVLEVIGNNVKTDMNSTEMKNFFNEYSGMKNATIAHKVLENSPEGLLTNPTNYPEEVGYILIPQAGQGNYSEINSMVENIFNSPEQPEKN
jgi:LCP family protein required for cell wall assembly